MTCEVCPHLAAIRAALAPCQTCEAGKLHGQVSVDASPTVDLVYAHAEPRRVATADGATALPPATETALRVALATIFAFDPVEVLLLRHTLAGGTFATFSTPLRDLRTRLEGYDLEPDAAGFRSLAHTWVENMKSKYPPLRAYFRASVAENRTRNAAHLALKTADPVPK